MPAHTKSHLLSTLKAHGRPLASFKRGDRVLGAGGMALKKGYSYRLDATPGDLKDNREFQPDLSPGEMLMLGVFEGKYLNDCVREFPAEWFVGALAMGRLSPERADPEQCNLFGVKSRQNLDVWRENKWVANRPTRARPSGRAEVGTSRVTASQPTRARSLDRAEVGMRGVTRRVPKSTRSTKSTRTTRTAKSRDILADANRNPDERGWFQWYCRYWMGRRLPELDHVQIGRWRSFRRHAGAVKAGCGRGTLSCRPRERQALLQWAYNPFI